MKTSVTVEKKEKGQVRVSGTWVKKKGRKWSLPTFNKCTSQSKRGKTAGTPKKNLREKNSSLGKKNFP